MGIKLLAFGLISIFCNQYVHANFCYNDVISGCSSLGGNYPNCNARYGAFKSDELMSSVQNYTNTHIFHSFEYLLMSSHFGNYQTNRAGFESLFRKLSDQTWEKAIDLAKFLGKRGGHMKFHKREEGKEREITYEMHELGSMAHALDIQKKLAKDGNLIHADVTRWKEHDSEVASYFENTFVHEHSEMIRKLSGHANDLKRLIADHPDPSLSVYLFDEYLKTTV